MGFQPTSSRATALDPITYPTPHHTRIQLKLPILILLESSFSTLNANTNLTPNPNCWPGRQPWLLTPWQNLPGHRPWLLTLWQSLPGHRPWPLTPWQSLPGHSNDL